MLMKRIIASVKIKKIYTLHCLLILILGYFSASKVWSSGCIGDVNKIIFTFYSIGLIAIVYIIYQALLDVSFKSFSVWPFQHRWIAMCNYATVFILSAVLVHFFVTVYWAGDYGRFIWKSTDARHYHWLSNHLLTMTWQKASFQTGLPLLLAPFNVVSGAFFSRDLSSLIVMNNFFFPFAAFIIFPLTLLISVKTSFLYSETQHKKKSLVFIYFTVVVLVAVTIYFFYILSPPSYATKRDALYHPLMMLGLVPSAEIFNILFSAIFCFAILHAASISPYNIGIICGLAAMVKETNAIIVLLFLYFIWIERKKEFKFLIKTIFASLTIYSFQFLYNFIVYDTLLFANRTHQWSPARAEKWAIYVMGHYGFEVDHAKVLSTSYFFTNIIQMIENYWWLILLIVISFLFLFFRCSERKYLHRFCIISFLSFIIFHACFIRIGATFRYMQAVFPQIIVLFFDAFQILLRDMALFNKRRESKKMSPNY